MHDESLGILKTLWGVDENGAWAITGIKGLYLKPRPGDQPNYFRPQSQFELLTNRPSSRDFLSSFGSTDFLLKQSIVPVVAIVDGESFVRCIGTAFFISCSGHVATAAHVLLDPIEAGYASSRHSSNDREAWNGFTMGVLVPINPAAGVRGSRFLAFTSARYWGGWKEQPLFNQRPSFAYDLDIAICKVDPIPDMTFQPLNISRIPMQCNQQAFALGFSEMPSFNLERRGNQTIIPDFNPDLFVSVGTVDAVFPENHSTMEVNSPGPCFRFDAFVPGRMSGGPIFGGDGEVVKGVVSTSASGERYAYGALWEPVFHLEIEGAETLKSMMLAGSSGITRIDGF